MAVIESNEAGEFKVLDATQGESFRFQTKDIDGYRYVSLSDVMEYAAWRVKCALRLQQETGHVLLPPET